MKKYLVLTWSFIVQTFLPYSIAQNIELNNFNPIFLSEYIKKYCAEKTHSELEQLLMLSKLRSNDMLIIEDTLDINKLTFHRSTFDRPKFKLLSKLNITDTETLIENLISIRISKNIEQYDSLYYLTKNFKIKSIKSENSMNGREIQNIYEKILKDINNIDNKNLISLDITRIQKVKKTIEFTVAYSLAFAIKTFNYPFPMTDCFATDKKAFVWDHNECGHTFDWPGPDADLDNGYAFIRSKLNKYYLINSDWKCDGSNGDDKIYFIGTPIHKTFFPWEYPDVNPYPNNFALITRCWKSYQWGEPIEFYEDNCVPASEINYFIQKAFSISNNNKPAPNLYVYLYWLREGYVSNHIGICSPVSYYWMENQYRIPIVVLPI